MQTWISYYIRGKLMWDANADVAALKKDFYTTFFGARGRPAVQQWWDACERRWRPRPCTATRTGWSTTSTRSRSRSGSTRTSSRPPRRAMTPKQKERFEAFALIADHLEAFAAMEEAEKNLDYAEAGRAGPADGGRQGAS